MPQGAPGENNAYVRPSVAGVACGLVSESGRHGGSGRAVSGFRQPVAATGQKKPFPAGGQPSGGQTAGRTQGRRQGAAGSGRPLYRALCLCPQGRMVAGGSLHHPACRVAGGRQSHGLEPVPDPAVHPAHGTRPGALFQNRAGSQCPLLGRRHGETPGYTAVRRGAGRQGGNGSRRPAHCGQRARGKSGGRFGKAFLSHAHSGHAGPL